MEIRKIEGKLIIILGFFYLLGERIVKIYNYLNIYLDY